MARPKSTATDEELAMTREILGITGMTLVEAKAYLESRSIPASIPALKAWSRGSNVPPRRAMEELWKLARALIRLEQLPADVPESVDRRRSALIQLTMSEGPYEMSNRERGE